MTRTESDAATIFEISSQAVDQLAANDPILATHIGVSGHDGSWTDFSPAGQAKSRQLAADLQDRARAATIDSRWDRLAQRVLIEHCQEMIDFVDAGDHLRDLNNIASPLQLIRSIFDLMPTETTEDWQNIADRLESMDIVLRGYQASLEEGRQQDRTVALRQVEEAINQARMAAGETSSLARLDASTVEDLDLRERIDAGQLKARAAFGELGDYLASTYLPDSRRKDGVGREAYARATRRYLGADLDLDETYRWGWSEVERLRSELTMACAEFDSSATQKAVFEQLKTDPAFAATSLDEFIELMAARQELAFDALSGHHFDIPESIHRLDVRVEPAGGALAPNYTGPSEDFRRPGIVWYPVEGQDFFPLYEEITTAYHEGLPGHHLQVGSQTAAGDLLSRFHSIMVWYPGAGEGWALYAEHLMDELGYLERPEYRIGYIASQLFRSCRIAIDIGMHVDLPIPEDASFHPGERWSFDLAYEMLTEVALIPADMANSEVTRYFGWPGQAISYKVGERAIHKMRAQAEKQPDFDAKMFHAELLSYGAVGLDLMDELMAS
jgi:uncharacterized protein (DUF885 family)